MPLSVDEIEYRKHMQDQKGCFFMTWFLIIGVIAAICIGNYFNGLADVERAKADQYRTVQWMYERGYLVKPRKDMNEPIRKDLHSNKNGGFDLR